MNIFLITIIVFNMYIYMSPEGSCLVDINTCIKQTHTKPSIFYIYLR